MILSDKDLMLLHSMPTSSEPDSSGSQGDLKIEFDGTTVLCRVCGDKASGFHYGVHSCEGCKGFFRRSIQQKIQYRPCTKNQQCSILRINRNRCQYCRLKKCIAVGMSRDAVRFGRVPKREKAKILAAMQKVNQNSQEKLLNESLEDENKLLSTILQAHEETCDYTREKVAPLIERARTQPVYAQCPPSMACPLNPMPQHVENGENRILEDFSERFSPAIRGVVEFAKRIPGFAMLSQDDQVTLLKAGVFEVLLVRLACMFDSQTNSMICLNGLVLRREALHSVSNARFLMDSMFKFAEGMNGLKLTDHELGLFCAVVVIAPDRPGLRNSDLVQKINRKLESLLQKSVSANHPDTAGLLLSELKKKIPDLRTLNALHSDKLLAYKMEPQNHHSGSSVASSTSNGGDVTMSGVVNKSVCHYASMIPDHRWQQFAKMNNGGQGSPQSGGGSDWGSEHKDNNSHDVSYGSPRSVSSSESIKSPPRSASVSSAKSGSGGHYLNGETLNGTPERRHSPSISDRCPVNGNTNKRPISSNKAAVSSSSSSLSNGSPTSSQEAGHSSGDEGTSFYSSAENHATNKASMSGAGATFSKIRRVDSPTDSGIESGKEHGNASTPTTSVCSSPRSALDEKVKDVSDSEGSEKQETIDDMPMLKRALQAPPLINTNMLMDEAYRHHKKFRNSKRESTSPAPSTAVSSATSPASESLASSHSTLVKTLEQAPRYLNEQQMKRTDLIHNIIMRTESVVPCSSSTSDSAATGRHPQFPLQQQALGKGVLVGPHGYYIPAPFNTTSSGGGCQYNAAVARNGVGPQSLSPRSVTYSNCSDQPVTNGSGSLPTALQAQSQRRSPQSTMMMVSPALAVTAPNNLVMETQPSPSSSKSAAPPSQLHHHLTSPHHHLLANSRSPSSSPHILLNSSAAIKMNQSDPMSDSQPLNLSMSKRV